MSIIKQLRFETNNFRFLEILIGHNSLIASFSDTKQTPNNCRFKGRTSPTLGLYELHLF